MVLSSCATDDMQHKGQTVADGSSIEFTATTTTAVNETRGVEQAPLKVSGYSKELWLIPSVQDAAKDVTRGTQLTSTSVLEDFGVSAYLHGSTEDITEKRPDFFYNKHAVRDANTGKYSFDQIYYWPASNERLSFMAYAPYESALAVLADADKSQPDPGAQKINFTVASTVTDQVDLMTATTMLQSPSTTGTPSVALEFQHQLAGIRFVVGQQFPTQGYIQKITLKNVYASGIYTLSDGATPGSWVYGSRYDYVAGTADQELTGEVGQAITTATQTFLMLPCTFASNDAAEVEIDYWDGYAKHTVTASLTGVTWEAGKTYTYELSSENLTKLKVESIAFAPTVSDAPHSDWQTGDKVGLYVVQGKDAQGNPDGITLRYKNIPVTCTVSTIGSEKVVTWEVDHTTSQGNVYKLPGDSYYFYYPYKEGTPDGYPNECNQVNATAPTFFSSVIGSHTVFVDQSGVGAAEGNFEKSDLQIAKAIVPEDDNSQLPASTIKCSLVRQVGLAVIEFPKVSILVDSVMLNNVQVANSPREDVQASANFVNNIPRQSGEKYYYFVKPSTSNTIFNSEIGLDDSWTHSIDVSLSAGETGYYKAYSKRYTWTYLNSVKWNYDYQGAGTTFTTPWSGTYKFECWGASGGRWSSNNTTGFGGYVSGNITLNSATELYVYVEQEGASNKSYRYNPTVSFNGGGKGVRDSYTEVTYTSACGGGATDIRTKEGLTDSQKNSWAAAWNNTYGLRGRIMVAAGGGGDGYAFSGSGGGINGLNSSNTTGSSGALKGCTGASQVAGGTSSNGRVSGSIAYSPGNNGSFGVGGDCVTGNNINPGGGGGGGYWGGAAGGNGSTGMGGAGGSGGSSYVSGHPGCIAIDSASGTSPKGGTSTTSNLTAARATHYSGLFFSNTKIIDGSGYNCISTNTTSVTRTAEQMPNPQGGSYELGRGHLGNGYVTITLTR